MTSVDAVQRGHEAVRLVQRQPPDLLITAMQLPDGTRNRFARNAVSKLAMHRTMVVLHSSDSTIDDLLAVGSRSKLDPRPEERLGPITSCTWFMREDLLPSVKGHWLRIRSIRWQCGWSWLSILIERPNNWPT